MIARLPSIVLAGLMAFCLAVTGASAQERSSRTLFEVLFGTPQPQAQPQAPASAQPQPQTRPQPQARPVQPAPQPSPAPAARAEIDKVEGARRIAVFGDSLAFELSRALDRLYADTSDVAVINEGVGSSGFVRDDFFDWNQAIEDAVAANGFDVAVVAIGINDRQVLDGAEPLSDAWRDAYRARLDRFLNTLRAGDKPVVWIELPPMSQSSYGAAMVQISAIHKAAVAAAGGAFVETFERYMGEDGGYSATGPDLSGNIVTMRNTDGIHFSAAGADKLAFYVDRAMGQESGTGTRVSLSGSTLEVADLLAGTDAAGMIRPPFQGLEQVRLFDMASIVQDLGTTAYRANDLIVAGTPTGGTQGFDVEAMLAAPAGRVDAFGVGRTTAGVENPRGR